MRLTLAIFTVLACLSLERCQAFTSMTVVPSIARAEGCSSLILKMGLYDRPLPPRPAPTPRDDNDKSGNDIEKENDESVDVSKRLFEFNSEGLEVNDRLPPLRRKLKNGIDCYFEPTDRLVRNLVGKTSCAVEDACWALEACQGDITEAWTRISLARRTMLDQDRISRLLADEDYDDDDYDLDEYDAEIEAEYRQRKSAQQARFNQQATLDSRKPDADWLPMKNPRPIDDEPWFTG